MATPTFIVLEGIDGSGTTSQCQALATALRRRGHRVLATREPSDGPIGTTIRQCLGTSRPPLDPAALALLFAADRIDHVRREIHPWLGSGGVVVCDRYILSSLVYQSLDCDPQWIAEINRQAPWPDLTIVLDVPADVAMQRVNQRLQQQSGERERWDDLAIQTRLARLYSEATADDRHEGVFVVDGTPDRDAVFEIVLDVCVKAGL